MYVSNGFGNVLRKENKKDLEGDRMKAKRQEIVDVIGNNGIMGRYASKRLRGKYDISISFKSKATQKKRRRKKKHLHTMN